ncbi:hypothetical protein LMG23994_06898 [Cupriavidus pinatubonensis]|uniref:Uncharacterized protein n=1 Tax=Cupriavidus pinatubonensis TaxID=248026 RepID=A0ABN7ZNE7_9BURK|nr:hypothetical protein LMG23994_06898 [Cupriavidus pinatubonensis]
MVEYVTGRDAELASFCTSLAGIWITYSRTPGWADSCAAKTVVFGFP